MSQINLPVRKPGQVGRERILPVLLELVDALNAIDTRLAALEARSPVIEIREWRPDHRRLVDNGTPVRKQRKNVRTMFPGATIRKVV